MTNSEMAASLEQLEADVIDALERQLAEAQAEIELLKLLLAAAEQHHAQDSGLLKDAQETIEVLQDAGLENYTL